MNKLAYSIEESATLLSISKAHLHRLINSGTIRIVTLGKRKVIPATVLEQLMAEQINSAVKGGDGE